MHVRQLILISKEFPKNGKGEEVNNIQLESFDFCDAARSKVTRFSLSRLVFVAVSHQAQSLKEVFAKKGY